MNVKITPYHLFCIIKQYGENIELFHPDIKKQNDYYFIANGIIYSDIELISFTMKEDDICKSCVYNENSICKKVNKNYENMNELLFIKLDIVENCYYNFNYIIELLQSKINFKMINECYHFYSLEEKREILKNIKNGLDKLINK
ncbi:MAG: hypothetical protein ACLUZU_14940 [Faecalibacillus intestinalis]|uniref:hypothetical protein n=1 Tax=Faecalibacillus intestinalis TaxID=1982626 RepID=UPI000E50F5AE|nr:hypothetical protein [Faecalibacillus intestinalis]RHP48645.1 hypothetical protein DWZ30_14490 [Coprobacillus sp. AF31-1BH]RHR18090.1 hypothetical protein DWX48_05605 [Coprobacillus sp. AF19-3]RHR85658.1 hypothetical protein DWW38_12480 [Coprobacillus sp. AF15-30]RHT53196.1 hypothetical protein DW760_04850 [Coprobacillus sp. AM29-13]